jgi:hypothetical protein
MAARHKSPDQAAAGSIEPESHLAPANGINNLQMTFWRVEISGVLRGQSSVGAQEISHLSWSVKRNLHILLA